MPIPLVSGYCDRTQQRNMPNTKKRRTEQNTFRINADDETLPRSNQCTKKIMSLRLRIFGSNETAIHSMSVTKRHIIKHLVVNRS
ncbi:hypothetical protein EUGRSUZ_E02944 [Eucalyptus grandis]|uniref:Uncharacterized protein n=2 Tax=Eucalyptus grandis TaxID=71139 RepID=A0ACC3KX46_EUCGR|nr:hypothetical protein EUGRSUZ_E02944 [Eucalyptus grandis]